MKNCILIFFYCNLCKRINQTFSPFVHGSLLLCCGSLKVLINDVIFLSPQNVCVFYLEKHCDELFVINITVAINVRFGKVKQNRKFPFKWVMGQLWFEKIILLCCLFDPRSFIDKFLRKKNLQFSTILRYSQTDVDIT